jgi:hypothetical protein
MTDLQALIRAIDELKPEEFEQLYDYISQRRRSVRWWVVPPENIAKIREAVIPLQEDSAKLSDEEINAVIDEALAEVRRERREHQGRD